MAFRNPVRSPDGYVRIRAGGGGAAGTYSGSIVQTTHEFEFSP